MVQHRHLRLFTSLTLAPVGRRLAAEPMEGAARAPIGTALRSRPRSVLLPSRPAHRTSVHQHRPSLYHSRHAQILSRHRQLCQMAQTQL